MKLCSEGILFREFVYKQTAVSGKINFQQISSSYKKFLQNTKCGVYENKCHLDGYVVEEGLDGLPHRRLHHHLLLVLLLLHRFRVTGCPKIFAVFVVIDLYVHRSGKEYVAACM